MTTTTTMKPSQRSPVPVRPPAASLDLGDLLARLFGDQPAGLLRVTAGHDDAGDSEQFYRRTREGWTWPRSQGHDTPLDFLIRNADAPCGWSPLVYGSPATGGPVKIPALWAAWPRVVIPHRSVPSYGVVDPLSDTETVTKVAALSPLPSVVLDTGTRLVAFWRLAAPLTSVVAAENRLTRLAIAHGALREVAVVARLMTFPVPGTVAPGIIPARRVTAVALATGTVTLDDLAVAS